MDIKQFAEQHKIKTRRDACGDVIISGKIGHIGDGYAEKLGVYVSFPTPRIWNHSRKKLETAGFKIKQNGDAEGVALFDPANANQARTALKVARVRVRRSASPASPARVAALRMGLAAWKARELQKAS